MKNPTMLSSKIPIKRHMEEMRPDREEAILKTPMECRAGITIPRSQDGR